MKIEEKVIDCLFGTSLFKGIDKAGIHNMIQCLNPRIHRYKKNESIAIAGEPFYGIGIVIEGEAVIAKENIAGNRAILTVLRQGDMFGEMISFTEKKVWPVNVTAQFDSEIVFVSPENIITRCEKMCDSHQILIQNMLKIMSRKALLLSRKVDYLSIRSLRGRLSAYLIEQWQIQDTSVFSLPMNRDELADFFNVARPSISRELGKMKDEGLIDFHKSSFKILDLEALKKVI
ncbi:Crp/Fnr family transcriptional regulator [Fusibacter bizertensis]|uniref:Crp/Fnr family transcriptional regulator n=1 Tax=Fusibacter bizertensis TaxID=1488331 RepID=A0ABT6NB32_9FIRM|nr:Crp/Fnr family transcriptional regulator [Fusibacter bizertensis]MDH8677623.1 Crp/Fnr family transcriptional regulator [Fusibacter bizertensis]